MAKVFEKTKMLTDVPFHYCPGCTHGIAHRLVAEVLEELGAEGHCIGIASVGCSVFSYNYFNCDMIQASHGRAYREIRREHLARTGHKGRTFKTCHVVPVPERSVFESRKQPDCPKIRMFRTFDGTNDRGRETRNRM